MKIQRTTFEKHLPMSVLSKHSINGQQIINNDNSNNNNVKYRTTLRKVVI